MQKQIAKNCLNKESA
uniref:Uncharacterized protein n=1 Tax=Anguilla anguilla TaxID=7936 RepID=A0A0E9V3T9_ANGAN